MNAFVLPGQAGRSSTADQNAGVIAGLGSSTADATATIPGALATVGTPPEVTAALAEDLFDHPAGTLRRGTSKELTPLSVGSAPLPTPEVPPNARVVRLARSPHLGRRRACDHFATGTVKDLLRAFRGRILLSSVKLDGDQQAFGQLMDEEPRSRACARQ
ncbi:hypothetical protein [Streptomyces sp. NPDC052127]|uniref:hypothetical protein n=1 Tax=Streptomyces sp. NPDC052127 TaxID=3155679 RepID=UPI0034450357